MAKFASIVDIILVLMYNMKKINVAWRWWLGSKLDKAEVFDNRFNKGLKTIGQVLRRSYIQMNEKIYLKISIFETF